MTKTLKPKSASKPKNLPQPLQEGDVIFISRWNQFDTITRVYRGVATDDSGNQWDARTGQAVNVPQFGDSTASCKFATDKQERAIQRKRDALSEKILMALDEIPFTWLGGLEEVLKFAKNQRAG